MYEQIGIEEKRPLEAKQARAVSQLRFTVAFLFACFLIARIIVGGTSLSFFEDFERLKGFGCLLLIGTVLIFRVFPRTGGFQLDLLSPDRFYAIFYAAYYLLPFGIIISSAEVGDVRLSAIGLAILIGFVSFQLGCNSSSRRVWSFPNLNEAEAFSLLVTCGITVLLIGWYQLWRLQSGTFYYHAGDYTVGTDLRSSLFESFVYQLQIPTILLLGLIAGSTTSLARTAKLCLGLYTFLLFFIFIGSSQFRPAISVLVFGWVSKNLFKSPVIKWGGLVRILVLGLLALALIFTVRLSDRQGQLVGSSNQAVDLLKGIRSGELFDSRLIEDAILGSTEQSSSSRATAPLLFFDEVIGTLERPYQQFGFGDTFFYEIKETFPRLLWPEKPSFLSTQIYIRQQLGLTIIDSSPHPLLQFYYEFGWPGIFIGFFLLGALIRQLTNRLNSLWSFFLIAFVWSALVQIEVGVFLNLIVVIRASLVLYSIWKLVHLFSGNERWTIRGTRVTVRNIVSSPSALARAD